MIIYVQFYPIIFCLFFFLEWKQTQNRITRAVLLFLSACDLDGFEII